MECRGNAKSLLPTLLESVRGESLGVSLLFDPQYCHHQTTAISSPNIPDTSKLKETVAAFKVSLKLPSDRLREIEQSTREQRHSELWFSVRRYRMTASRFGEILRRKPTTPPDALVLSILQPRSFSSAATDWGIQNESLAIQAYLSYQCQQGNDSITVGPSGILVSETHPFLGATPDGTIYDPLNSKILLCGMCSSLFIYIPYLCMLVTSFVKSCVTLMFGNIPPHVYIPYTILLVLYPLSICKVLYHPVSIIISASWFPVNQCSTILCW